MADTAAYSPKQFQLAFVGESIVGTKNVTSMQLINVDSVELPGLNPTQVFDVRSGSGRTLKSGDVYIDEDLSDKEISFSGTADTTVLPLLLRNITNADQRGASAGTYPAAYVVPDSFEPAEMKNGTTSSDINNTATVAVLSPESTGDIVFPGCRLTSLSISGDMGTETGRIKISGTWKTKFTAVTGQNVTSPSAYGSTYYNMNSMSTTKTVAGASSLLMQSFSLNIENPAEYLGYETESAKQEPEVIAIAIPEISATCDATFKYDSGSVGLDATFAAGTAGLLHLSDNANWHSATTFGIYSKKSYITSLAYSESAAMMMDVSLKLAADSAGTAPEDSLFELIA